MFTGLKSMLKHSGIIAMIACLMTGCDLENPLQPDVGNNISQTNDVAVNEGEIQIISPTVICVGVENGYAGDCPGTTKDSNATFQLLRGYSTDIQLFQNEGATKSIVSKALKTAVESSPFVIFYYSGHGGQSYSGDSSEADGRDEYICLYDQPLLDNDIWSIISKGQNVMLIFDCCHSETMYRTARFNESHKAAFAAARSSVNMICWSGCPDDTYSYGSSNGGYLTNTILKHYKESLTYDELWTAVKTDKTLKQYEAVQQTKLGKDVWNMPIFTLQR